MLEALRIILLVAPSELLFLIGRVVSSIVVVVVASLRLLLPLIVSLTGCCRCATISKVLVIYDKVVGLGRIRCQIEVLAEEAEQLV